MSLRTCWTIDADGCFLEADLQILDGRLLLSSPDLLKRDLGPVSSASMRSIKQLGTESFQDLNYFHDFQRCTLGFAATTIELLDECNLRCSTCIASSSPGRGKIKDQQSLLDEVKTSQRFIGGNLFLSGGEPTIHPNFNSIVQNKILAFREIYIITNGTRLAKEVGFAFFLKKSNPNIHIYLQYDSFREKDLRYIRGQDLSEIRRKAIENLEIAEINYTLIAVVMRGVNDDILGDIVRISLDLNMCRGVTFQPIKFVGRNESASRKENFITAFDVALKIESQVRSFRDIELLGHPLNPLNWQICYIDKNTHTTRNDKVNELKSLYLNGNSETGFKRVAIIWHTDFDNFVAESVCPHPHGAVHKSTVRPLMIHYSASD